MMTAKDKVLGSNCKKESISMTNHRAAITSIREAVAAIRGFNRKFLTLLVDLLNIPNRITIIAYEADE